MVNNLKIAFILPSLANKGPNLVALELANYFNDLGLYVKVFYFDKILDLSFQCDAQRIRWFDTPSSLGLNKFDIVHSHMFRPDLWCGIFKCCGLFGPKLITTIHQDIDENLSRDYSYFKYKIGSIIWFSILKKFDNIVCLTDFYKRRLVDILLDKSIRVVGNGRNLDLTLDVDPIDLLHISKIKEQYKVIGSIGNLTSLKAFEQIIFALVNLSDYAFILIGDGSQMSYLKSIAAEYGVANRCVFLGSKLNAYRYIKYFDVYILTSRTEGFPLVMIEAALLGRPIVCSRIPSTKEIFNDSLVKYFDLDDIEGLSRSVEAIYNEKEAFSSRIFEYASKKLTTKYMCDKYLKIYNTIIRNDHSECRNI